MSEEYSLIIEELQADAEKELGPMPGIRGEVPTLEFIFKFYKFYIDKSPDNLDTHKNMMIMQMIVNKIKL
jgi:hypothetical protein